MLRDGDEGDPVAVKDVVDHAGEIDQRTGQPVDFVDDDYIDPARLDIGHQPLQRGAVHVAAGVSPVVIQVWKRGPPGMLLAQDEGRTGLPLRPRGMSHWSLLCLR